MTEFRVEKSGDEAAIRNVNEQAFGQPGEANLVDALRDHNAVVLSMVAVEDNEIVGHALFTEVTIYNPGGSFQALGLGPMAVLPAHQRGRIGSQLLKEALAKCRELGHEIVVVVGYPEFYSRFGFVPARGRGLECEFDVPDEAFMVLELRRGVLAGRTGCVRYRQEFRDMV
ncbi:MAG: GNAT family N-acetyltransferase [Planctomycetota bacterium]|jgi:putative acetyltransferase